MQDGDTFGIHGFNVIDSVIKLSINSVKTNS